MSSPDVENIPTGDEKRRLTMGIFMSWDGEVMHPTFVDNHVNRSFIGYRQTKMEYKKEYVDSKGKLQKFTRRSYEKYDFYYNSSGWVTQEIFKLIMQKFDRAMRNKDLHPILFLDNATCHMIDFSPYV